IAGTKDGQKALQDLETRFAPKRKEIEKKQQGIQQMQAQLQKGGSILSDDQKRKLMSDIDSQTKTLNRDVEDASAELEQEQNKIFQEILGKMQTILDRYSKEKNLALILDVSSQQTPVLWAAAEVEITKDIVDLYDKAAPAAGAPAAPGAKPPTPKPQTP